MKTQAIPANELKLTASKAAAIKVSVIAVLSFVIARCKLLGAMSPFGISLTAALPLNYAVVTYIGSLIGYGILGFSANNLLYMITLTLILAVKIAFRGKKISKNPVFLSVMTFVCFSVVNGVGTMLLHFTPVDMGLRVCESIIASGVTCFMCFASGAVLSSKIRQFTNIEIASLGIIVMLAVVALLDVNFFGFNVGVIFGVLCLYFAVYQWGTVGGAIGGILMAIALNLYNTDLIYLSGVLVVAAFIAGAFQPIGKLGQVAVFMSISLFAVFIIGVNLPMLFHLVNIFIASGFFLMLPQKYLKFLTIEKSAAQYNDVTIKENIENRLDFAAETIRDLQCSLEQVSNKLNKTGKVPFSEIANKTACSVCKNCGLNLFCWDEHYNETADRFQKLLRVVREKGEITQEEIQQDSLINCCRTDYLSKSLNEQYREYISKQNAKRRVGEVRDLAIEQLSGVSQMLWEVSGELSDMRVNNNDAAEAVSALFTTLAAEPQSVFCTINQYDRMELDIYTQTGVKVDQEQLCTAVSKVLEREFAMPSVSSIGNKVKISFYEKANFSLDFGGCQISSNADQKDFKLNHSVCGDSYDYFLDNKGNAYLVLSDGMGCGKKAALDSSMTCSIVIKLVKAGFGLDSIIKFVNSSLQVKSTEESLSTIDIVKMDLYTGQAEFCKAGSAYSLVKLGDKLVTVETNSLPVGILQGIEFDKQTLMLHQGDCVVMMSDGVEQTDEKILRAAISKFRALPAQELAEKLAKLARDAAGDSVHDDITILVAKLDKGV